jgi:hypothetical protein
MFMGLSLIFLPLRLLIAYNWDHKRLILERSSFSISVHIMVNKINYNWRGIVPWGTAGHRLWPKILDTTNDEGTKYPIPDMVPPLLAEEEGPPT